MWGIRRSSSSRFLLRRLCRQQHFFTRSNSGNTSRGISSSSSSNSSSSRSSSSSIISSGLKLFQRRGSGTIRRRRRRSQTGIAGDVEQLHRLARRQRWFSSSKPPDGTSFIPSDSNESGSSSSSSSSDTNPALNNKWARLLADEEHALSVATWQRLELRKLVAEEWEHRIALPDALKEFLLREEDLLGGYYGFIVIWGKKNDSCGYTATNMISTLSSAFHCRRCRCECAEISVWTTLTCADICWAQNWSTSRSRIPTPAAKSGNVHEFRSFTSPLISSPFVVALLGVLSVDC